MHELHFKMQFLKLSDTWPTQKKIEILYGQLEPPKLGKPQPVGSAKILQLKGFPSARHTGVGLSASR